MNMEKIISTGIKGASNLVEKKSTNAISQISSNAEKKLDQLNGLDTLAQYNMPMVQKASPWFMLDSKTLEAVKDELLIFTDELPDDKTISYAVSTMCDYSPKRGGYDLQGIFATLNKLKEKTPKERETLFDSNFISLSFSIAKDKGFKFSFFDLPSDKIEELNTLLEDDLTKALICDFIKQKDNPWADINKLLPDLQKFLDNLAIFTKEKHSKQFYSLLSTRKMQDIDELTGIILNELKKCPDGEVKDFHELLKTLLEAKTPDGKFIFGASELGDKTSKTMLDGIENILSAKRDDPEKFDQLMYILQLTKDGKIPPSVLGTLAKEGEITPEFLAKITNDVESGILKFENKSSALKEAKDGDVLQIGQELFYKNKESLQSLNLDPKTYEKLFPAIQTMAIEQGELGDCYLVSAICDFLKNPDFKNVIYQMFEKDGDDIIVRIPDAKDFPVRFANGILKKDGNKNMNASLGIQMLEEAYKKTRALKYGTADKLSAIEGGAQLNVYRAFLPNQKAHSYTIADENQKAPTKDEILELIQNIDETIEDLSKKVKPDLKKTGSLFGDLEYGINEELKQKISLYEAMKRVCFETIDTLDCYHDVSENELLEKLIESTDSGHIVSLGSKGEDGWLNRAKLIHSKHAYSVLSIDKDKKTISVINPWNSAQYSTITFEEFKKYFSMLSTASAT